MKTVNLKREPSDTKQTLGTFSCETFTTTSLELPWKNNANEISCIPKGTYTCKYTKSTRLSKLKGYDFYTYEVLNVPNRAGIRIHSANYFHDLLGCIGLGVKSIDIDKDGELDISSSRSTIASFEKFMKQEDFKLIIE